jgi:hypothetical protein
MAYVPSYVQDTITAWNPDEVEDNPNTRCVFKEVHQICHDRARSILEHVGEAHITPYKFVELLEADIGGSHQKIEDDAFRCLY